MRAKAERQNKGGEGMYKVIFEDSRGRQFETWCDHAPTLGVVIRVPGTETYARVIGVSPRKAL